MSQSAQSEDKQTEPLELAPADAMDPVIEVYKKNIDQTLLSETLRMTPAERCERFLKSMRLVYELRRAGEKLRKGADKRQT